MTENTPIKETTWEEELKQSDPQPENFEKTPILKLETGKIVKFTIDQARPIKEWRQDEDTVKKIIPVLAKGEKRVIFLNVKNPLWGQIKDKVRKNELEISVSTTGSQANTRYQIVEEA